jgi:hypothetical protein
VVPINPQSQSQSPIPNPQIRNPAIRNSNPHSAVASRHSGLLGYFSTNSIFTVDLAVVRMLMGEPSGPVPDIDIGNVMLAVAVRS